MKELLKNLGIIILLSGVVVLILDSTKTHDSNNGLMISGILVVVGFLVHIIVNRQIE